MKQTLFPNGYDERDNIIDFVMWRKGSDEITQSAPIKCQAHKFRVLSYFLAAAGPTRVQCMLRRFCSRALPAKVLRFLVSMDITADFKSFQEKVQRSLVNVTKTAGQLSV